MRHTGKVYVDGVEVDMSPPAPIERARLPLTERQKFERKVKKSGAALWEFLSGEGGDLERAARAYDILKDTGDE